MLFDNWVQQSLSNTRNKRLTILTGEFSLDGLVIDWQFANSERMFDNYVDEPVSDYQPTYAYA